MMRRWAAHVIAPLAVGAAIYFGFRSDRLLGWQWADALGLGGIARSVRALFDGASVPDLVRFSVPDALWVYALAYAVARLQRTAPSEEQSAALVLPARASGAERRAGMAVERAAWLAIVLAFGPGVELFQLAGWVRGTFDPIDLALVSIAFVLGITTAAERGLVASEEAR